MSSHNQTDSEENKNNSHQLQNQSSSTTQMDTEEYNQPLNQPPKAPQINQAQFQKYFQDRSRVENYRILQYLDKGGSGIIKLCQKFPDEQTRYVIKIYKNFNQQSLNDMLREVNVLQALNHPNILRMIDYFPETFYIKPNNQQKKITAVVLEFCENQSIFEYIKMKTLFEDSISRRFFLDLVSAINDMHKNNLTHRDIKPENILLTSDYYLKVADFGYSTNLDKYGVGQKLRTKLGTKTYMAPELVLGNQYDGKEVDIFALGVVLFIMVIGHYPFTEAKDSDKFFKAFETNNELFWKSHMRSLSQKVGEQNAQRIITPSFINLINGMLARENRATLQKVMNHDWTIHGNVATQQQVVAYLQQIQQQVEEDRKPPSNDNSSGGSRGGNYPNIGKFRDVDPDMLPELDFGLLEKEWEKNYSYNFNSQRTIKTLDKPLNDMIPFGQMDQDDAFQWTIYFLEQINKVSATKKFRIQNIHDLKYKIEVECKEESNVDPEFDDNILNFAVKLLKYQEKLYLQFMRLDGDFVFFKNICQEIDSFISKKEEK